MNEPQLGIGTDPVDNVNRIVARHQLKQELGRSPSESEIEEQLRAGPRFRTFDDVFSALMWLSERQAGVLRLRAGLTGEPTRSVQEVASIYGVTSTRITQLEATIAAKLAAPTQPITDADETAWPSGSAEDYM